MPPVASRKGIPVALITNLTTGTSEAIAIPITSKHLLISLSGTGTITAGTLLIEESNSFDLAGIWSQLYSATLTGVTAGATQILHFKGTFNFIRARFSANVTGGGNVSATVTSD